MLSTVITTKTLWRMNFFLLYFSFFLLVYGVCVLTLFLFCYFGCSCFVGYGVFYDFVFGYFCLVSYGVFLWLFLSFFSLFCISVLVLIAPSSFLVTLFCRSCPVVHGSTMVVDMTTYYQVLHDNPWGTNTVPGRHAGVNVQILGKDSTSLTYMWVWNGYLFGHNYGKLCL